MKTDVAIVGFGPTGATLANLLAECGITVTVIEREAAMYHLPRAVHFDGECMRVFQAAGIADDLSKRVLQNPGMRFVSPEGDMLLDWPRPQGIGPQGWFTSYRLHQPDLETLLRQKLATRPGVTVLTQTEVVEAIDHGDHVLLACRDRETGDAVSVQASYVVGCDGARSTIRGAIGSAMDDLGFEERWLVIDMLLKRDRPDLGDHSVQYCDPERPMTYCRAPRNRRRWEITVHPDESDAEVTDPDRIWGYLARWLTPEDAGLERSAVYTFRSMVAQSWRKGRILIAGDAAHLTPPFMGQGMCAGIRDAANLAWKLALCVKGLATPDLLDSYQAERAPNARAFIETAMRLGGLINALDADSALEMAQPGNAGKARMQTIAPPLGPHDLTGWAATETPHKGQLFCQPRLSSGSPMDDVSGYAPILILRDAPPQGFDQSLPYVTGVGHPEIIAALDDLETNAVLLRPDRYIAATACTEKDIATLAAIPFPSPLNGKA
ncbi:bifunctional 3-(3-hydroxy-phenyl)propionate/3-hydroxycinnamic acid hydroxylase [uncultured Shimia sp.]|uniref:bifunctional 3-(3-hydroxy-phenyl)propionate/3-hydroxycinnamic acid hydroxylase MhpA n=1 Tax=uncultured Shimia sp. TaxID=573152 RepID=UPI00261021AC|nr:bifunctional 3-(3-hydroxy-phenyl)propionate/3-hydroxycinnamic acid hydroxylase [uncultured Shimia sp.]